jgi:hypothetical protein
MIQLNTARQRRPVLACCIVSTIAGLAALASPRAEQKQDGAFSMPRAIAYRVFVGAFRSETPARALCDPLIAQGHPLTVAFDPTNGTPLFVCRSERTYDRAEAKEVADRIKNGGGYKPIVAAVAPSLVESERSSSMGSEGSATDPLELKVRREIERFMKARERDVRSRP